MNSSIKNFVFWLVIAVSAFLLWQVVKAGPNTQGSPEISYSEFLSQVEAGTVSKVTISGNHVAGQYRDGRSFQAKASASQEGLIKVLHEKNVEIWFKDGTETGWRAGLLNIAPLVLLAALWFFMIRRMKQGPNQAQTNSNYPR